MFFGNDIQVYTTLLSVILPPLSSCPLCHPEPPLCHPERSEESPYAVRGVVSGRKGVKKCPVTVAVLVRSVFAWILFSCKEVCAEVYIGVFFDYFQRWLVKTKV